MSGVVETVCSQGYMQCDYSREMRCMFSLNLRPFKLARFEHPKSHLNEVKQQFHQRVERVLLYIKLDLHFRRHVLK